MSQLLFFSQMGQGHYVVAAGGSVPPPPPPMPAPVPPSSAPISVSSQQMNSFDPSSMDANAAHVELTNSLLCGRLGEQGLTKSEYDNCAFRAGLEILSFSSDKSF